MTTVLTTISNLSIKFDITKFLRKITAFFFALLIFLLPLHSEDWILAGEAFTLKQVSVSSESVRKITEVIPQLILEQISSSEVRVIPDSELLDRKLNLLQTERLSLFLQLEKEVKSRDSLVISETTPKKLEKAIINANEKIAEIQKKLDENLSATKNEIAKFNNLESADSHKEVDNDAKANEAREKNLKRKNKLFSFFKKDADDKIVMENVRLYKNDASLLYKASEKAASMGKKSYEFSKELLLSKINGLLTGSVSVYGDYIGVTAEIIVYPGAKSIGTVSEVGMVSDIVSLSHRLIQNMTPKIANSLPVVLEFDIASSSDDMIVRNPTVSIDGVVYPNVSEPILVGAGIHTVVVEAAGFERAVLTYAFMGEKLFRVEARLVPLINGTVNIRLKKFKDGLFYANAIESTSVDESNRYGRISVNGKNILAVFEDFATKNKSFIFVPFDVAIDQNFLVVNSKPFDRTLNIDKRRRGMYLAYTFLMCSLPITFYYLGEFDSENKAYARGSRSYNDALSAQRKSNIAQGISFAFGAWFVVELVRYLYAANRVLPDTARVDKSVDEVLKFQALSTDAEPNKVIEVDLENVENNESIENSSSGNSDKSRYKIKYQKSDEIQNTEKTE